MISQNPTEKDMSPQTPAECRKILNNELRRFRSLAREIASNLVVKIESRVEEVAKALDHSEPTLEQMQAMVSHVRELSVKPHKGRRKDLRRLEELLNLLAEEFASTVQKRRKGKSTRRVTTARVTRKRSTRRLGSSSPEENFSSADSDPADSATSRAPLAQETVPAV